MKSIERFIDLELHCKLAEPTQFWNIKETLKFKWAIKTLETKRLWISFLRNLSSLFYFTWKENKRNSEMLSSSQRICCSSIVKLNNDWKQLNVYKVFPRNRIYAWKLASIESFATNKYYSITFCLRRKNKIVFRFVNEKRYR